MKDKAVGSFPLVATATTVSSFSHFHHGLFLSLLLASSFVSSLAANTGSAPSFHFKSSSPSSPACPAHHSKPGKEIKEEKGFYNDPNKDYNAAMSCKCPLIEQEALNKLRDRAPSISQRLHESIKKALESVDETAEMIHLLKILEKLDFPLDGFHEKAQDLKNIFKEMHKHLEKKSKNYVG